MDIIELRGYMDKLFTDGEKSLQEYADRNLTFGLTEEECEKFILDTSGGILDIGILSVAFKYTSDECKYIPYEIHIDTKFLKYHYTLYEVFIAAYSLKAVVIKDSGCKLNIDDIRYVLETPDIRTDVILKVTENMGYKVLGSEIYFFKSRLDSYIDTLSKVSWESTAKFMVVFNMNKCGPSHFYTRGLYERLQTIFCSIKQEKTRDCEFIFNMSHVEYDMVYGMVYKICEQIVAVKKIIPIYFKVRIEVADAPSFVKNAEIARHAREEFETFDMITIRGR